MLIFGEDSIEHDTATKLSELQDSVRLLTALVLAIDSGLRAGIVGAAFPQKPVWGPRRRIAGGKRYSEH